VAIAERIARDDRHDDPQTRTPEEWAALIPKLGKWAFKNKGFMLSITKENQVMDDFKVGDKVKQKQTARCDDPSALVPYVLLSGYHLTDLLAWDEACVNVMKELNGR
jgi:hypothetical protein